MQISAANLLVASQQQAKPPVRPNQSAFAAALSDEKLPFEPLSFKSAVVPEQTAGATRPQPTALGSRVDIRV
ncbi:MAG: hypothetical protein KGJ79_07775 [Alphaproteobacteria bacterium]|nr:hypothetical protein [Alphaproteobacteria bacterium]MDE2111025.1 hypothetical protein [Alphaproteobacteria bacterium]MDE2493814.1 hypothetical protein [Alphaproteobacteria bacterium]